MLRKLIVFAITSGLAKKAYDHYRTRQKASGTPVRNSAADNNNSAALAQGVTPVSPMHYN